MTIDQSHLLHIVALIDEAQRISYPNNQYGQITDPRARAACVVWLAQAAQIAATVVADPANIYRQTIHTTATQTHTASSLSGEVLAVSSMLERLAYDLKAGFLGSQADRVSAATFDDLLDHASAYLDDGRREPAGVLAGVVFEDSARRVFRKVLDQSDKGKELEQVINALMKSPTGAPTINSVEGKRAKAAGDVRTRSTHAQWNEFGADDVEATIKFAREFIAKHLA